MSGSFSSPRQGDQYKFSLENLGHLVIVKPYEFLHDFPTQYGPQDTVRVDLVDLHEPTGSGEYGKVYRGALLFGKNLVPGLKTQVGELVLGRVGQGVAKGSQDPPWLLVDVKETEPAAVDFAETWLRQHPEFKNEATSSPSNMSAGISPSTALPVPSGPPIPAQMVQTVGGATFASQPPPVPTAGIDVSGASNAQVAAIAQLSDEHKRALAALGFPVQ